MKASRALVALSAMAALCTTPDASAVPLSFPYVGRLVHASGAPADGTYDIQVSLFTTPTPNPAVDVPAYGPCPFGGTPVVGGIFALVIGDCGPAPGSLPTVFADFDALWLAFEVDGELMLPLQSVHSVPYAFRAADADALGGTPAADYVVWSDIDTLDEAYVLKSGDTMTGPLAVEATLTAHDIVAQTTVSAPVFGKDRAWGTLVPGESIGININGLAAVNGNIGLVAAHIGANQDDAWSDSAYALLTHAHGGPYNDFTVITSRSPAGGYSVSGGSVVTFTNNSGTTARYVIRYLDLLRNHSAFLQ